MKVQELTNKKNSELEKIMLDLSQELFNLRFQKASGHLSNVSRIRVLRRQIARIKTIFSLSSKDNA